LFFENQDSAQFLSGFFTADYVPGKQNFYNYSIGGGLAYTGLFRKRPEDVLAIGAFCPFVNNTLVKEQSFAKNEIAAEINYNIKVNAFINLQPSFQYIHQPGAQRDTFNSVAFLLRCTVRNGLFN
jgi:carbohydrate-selective porin OprB